MYMKKNGKVRFRMCVTMEKEENRDTNPWLWGYDYVFRIAMDTHKKGDLALRS